MFGQLLWSNKTLILCVNTSYQRLPLCQLGQHMKKRVYPWKGPWCSYKNDRNAPEQSDFLWWIHSKRDLAENWKCIYIYINKETTWLSFLMSVNAKKKELNCRFHVCLSVYIHQANQSIDQIRTQTRSLWLPFSCNVQPCTTVPWKWPLKNVDLKRVVMGFSFLFWGNFPPSSLCTDCFPDRRCSQLSTVYSSPQQAGWLNVCELCRDRQVWWWRTRLTRAAGVWGGRQQRGSLLSLILLVKMRYDRLIHWLRLLPFTCVLMGNVSVIQARMQKAHPWHEGCEGKEFNV